MNLAKCVPIVLLLSFGAEANKNVEKQLSSETLDYQAGLICSGKYREPAASPSFKIKSGAFNATDLTPFNSDVLTAYRNFVKKNPGVEKLAADENNGKACEANVKEEYEILFSE